MNRKKKSLIQEKNVAKLFHAKPTISSGAIWSMKGDVRNEKFLIECKTTEKDFYTVTTKVWEKINQEAIKDHIRIPLLVVDLNQGKNRYIIFNPDDFETVIFIPIGSNKITGSFRIKSSEITLNNIYGFKIKTLEHIYLLAVCTEKVFYDYYNQKES